MVTPQGDVSMLNDPVAQDLLRSMNVAHLAYVWKDGTPRVIPIWFHWTGEEIVFGTVTSSPKVENIDNAKVAISIDGNAFPYHVLLIRGTAHMRVVPGIAPEYASAAKRYLGQEGGEGWLQQLQSLTSDMARIAVKPDWVGILDFETRLPSAIERAMETAQAQGGG